MKLIQKNVIRGKDFTGLYKCEFCENEKTIDGGYNDTFYFKNVIPSFKCEKCGKSTKGDN